MDNQDKLIDDVEVIAKKIKELHALAYVRYSRLVDAVLADSLTDEKQIEHILDGILDFGDEVRVWFDREYAKDGSPYLAIFCHVKKKDVPKFLAALEDLKNSMMLCGHPHYVEEISSFMDEMEKMKGELHGNENDAAQETEQKRTA